MSASAVLQRLPRDASAVLAGAQTFRPDSKVVVRFKAVGAAPALAYDVCKITAGRRFEEVVRYLRRKLRCRETDSVFLYVNSAFAPALDEVVGNLHQVRARCSSPSSPACARPFPIMRPRLSSQYSLFCLTTLRLGLRVC